MTAMHMNLAPFFINYGASSVADDAALTTYIAIINNKDGSTSTKCLNPSRRSSSSSASSVYAVSPSPRRKKRALSLIPSLFGRPSQKLMQPLSKRTKTAANATTTAPCWLMSLPIEVLHDIVMHLDTPSLLALACTSRLFRAIFYDDHLWQRRFAVDFDWASERRWKEQHRQLYRNHVTLDRRWQQGLVSPQYLENGHTSSVYCLARLGSTHMISGSRDRTLKLWHLPSRQLLQTKMTKHEGSVLCVAVSPDGKRLLTGSSDATCMIWNLDTWTLEGTLREHRHGVLGVCVMPNGQTFVSASRDHTLCVWRHAQNTPNGDNVQVLHRLEGHTGPVNAVQVYDDDHVVSASGDGTLKLWNIRTGACTKTFVDVPQQDDNTSQVSASLSTQQTGLACLQIDHQQGLLYSGAQNGKLKVWHVENEECCASLPGHHALIRTMHRHGNWLVTGSYDRTIKVWDMQKRQCIVSLSGHASWILNILVTRSKIISAGQDKQIMMLDFGHNLTPLDE
ncbi:WD40-repeat-containing domain protein [Gongronella butleri]|nr:WD40-repeat-containing domain protein [Gongronella butleri]